MKKRCGGFGFIEILVAVGIMLVMASAVTVVLLGSFSANRLADDETKATLIAQEGVEATKSIKNQAWTNVSGASGAHGVAAGASWSFAGTSDVNGKFTRQILISPVQRNGSNDIVASGGSVDADTMKVTSTVTWNFTTARPESVDVVSYLTNYEKAISIVGNWAAPSQEATVDAAGNQAGLKVQTAGNYAYVVRNGGVPNFLIVDITTPASPTVVGSLTLTGTPADIAVSGNVAYVASSSGTAELQIINIATPSSPSVTSTFDATGGNAAIAVYAVGTTVYLGKGNSGGPELFIVNASVPATPTLVGSLNLNGNTNEIFVLGTTAYVASSNDASELEVVNITVPAAPALLGTLDLSATSDGLTIDGFLNTVLIGRADGNTYIINTTTPSAPTLTATYTGTGGALNDISIGNNNTYAFLATSSGTQEFQVLNISTLASPTLLGSLNLSSTLNGIAYNAVKDRAVAVGANTAAEVLVLKSN